MDVKYFIIATFYFSFASAQLPINGTCPKFAECRGSDVVMTNEKLKGIWYLQYSIPYLFDLNKKCSYLNITAVPDIPQKPTQFYFDKFETEVS